MRNEQPSMERHHGLTKEQIEQEFQQQNRLLEKIYESGMQAYIQDTPDVNKAFNLSDRDLRCIDEGTPGGLHGAGSGILLGSGTAAKIYKPAGVTGVYSHEGCGAAALYAKEKGLPADEADELGRQFAQELAAKLGVPYQGHISFGQMRRPEAPHIARVAYYDGTGSFDYSKIKELPPGFIISRRWLPEGNAQQELKIAIDIALGQHGFGGLIDDKNPFVISSIGNQDLTVEDLAQEIQSLAAEYGGRVKVDGFSAPDRRERESN